MKKTLIGSKIAFLVANGLNERDLVEAQRVIQNLGADTRIISMDQGLVSSLNDQGWGLNFASDHALKASLAADYSAIVIPGGQRSIEKLQLTAHCKRFIRGFYDSQKPLCFMNEAQQLLEHSEINLDDNSQHVLVLDNNFEALDKFLKIELLEEQAVAA
ncbi:MAG: DJ-1/PfpI family protein [Bdellovibrionales bacterium]